MRLLYVPLPPHVRDVLSKKAREEHRRPQDQAAVLIEAALGMRAGCRCGTAGQSSQEEPELEQSEAQR